MRFSWFMVFRLFFLVIAVVAAAVVVDIISAVLLFEIIYFRCDFIIVSIYTKQQQELP